MDKFAFLMGFSLLLGLWNIWTDRRGRGTWFWVGVAMVAFAIALFAGARMNLLPR